MPRRLENSIVQRIVLPNVSSPAAHGPYNTTNNNNNYNNDNLLSQHRFNIGCSSHQSAMDVEGKLFGIVHQGGLKWKTFS